MTTGDMREGICGVCRGADVHMGELTGQMAMRAPGNAFGKRPFFRMYVCLDCGHSQFFYDFRGRHANWIRRTFRHVAPRRR